jgi:hypothetical protein
VTQPSCAWGQTNRPFSSRLANRHRPAPSHQRILIRSARLPRNRNRWPEKMAGKGILLDGLLRQRRQAGGSLAHIRGAESHVDADARRDVQHGWSTAATMRASAPASTPSSTRTTRPLVSAISTSPMRLRGGQAGATSFEAGDGQTGAGAPGGAIRTGANPCDAPRRTDTPGSAPSTASLRQR